MNRALLHASLCAGLLSGILPGHAQQGEQQAPPPGSAPAGSQAAPAVSSPPLLRREDTATLQATTRAVLLDVVVVDKLGRPVRGLTASDFTLFEDGQPQRLDSLHAHVPASSADAAAALARRRLPANTFTNEVPAGNGDASTVIFIDLANTPASAQPFARDQLISFLKTLPPGHPIAIFQMDTSMHLIQGFSSDPAVLLQAVQSRRHAIQPPLLPLGNNAYVYQRSRQDNLNAGLRAMNAYLAGFPGRKNLVWFTGSIPGNVYGGGPSVPFPDTEDFASELSAATHALAISRVAVYPVDARTLEANSSVSAESQNLDVRSNPFLPNRFYDHTALEDVATATGGKAFYNTNGLGDALAQIIESTSGYYTVAYTPSNRNWNGEYRAIKVVLNAEGKDTRGAKLEYRHGYMALDETTRQRRQVASLRHAAALSGQQVSDQTAYASTGPHSTLDEAMQLGAIPPTQLTLYTSVTPGTQVQKLGKNEPRPEGNYLREDLQGKPFRDYQVLYTVDPRTVRLTAGADGMRRGDLQFVAVLYDDQGEPLNSASTTVTMALTPADYSKMLRGAVGVKQTLAVPEKGHYFLRFGVHDAEGGKTGALEVPVDAVQQGVAGHGQTLTP